VVTTDQPRGSQKPRPRPEARRPTRPNPIKSDRSQTGHRPDPTINPAVHSLPATVPRPSKSRLGQRLRSNGGPSRFRVVRAVGPRARSRPRRFNACCCCCCCCCCYHYYRRHRRCHNHDHHHHHRGRECNCDCDRPDPGSHRQSSLSSHSSANNLVCPAYSLTNDVLQVADRDDADSTLGEEREHSLTSITSSVLAYQEENGRRYHALSRGKYVLPNDEVRRQCDSLPGPPV
jgi:hypothetical protein